jgi:hypothetical protein
LALKGVKTNKRYIAIAQSKTAKGLRYIACDDWAEFIAAVKNDSVTEGLDFTIVENLGTLQRNTTTKYIPRRHDNGN